MVRKYKVIPLDLSLNKILRDWNQVFMCADPIRNVTFVYIHEIRKTISPKTLFFYFCIFTSIFKICIKQTSQQSA